MDDREVYSIRFERKRKTYATKYRGGISWIRARAEYVGVLRGKKKTSHLGRYVTPMRVEEPRKEEEKTEEKKLNSDN